jgi:hypothetical protein
MRGDRLGGCTADGSDVALSAKLCPVATPIGWSSPCTRTQRAARRQLARCGSMRSAGIEPLEWSGRPRPAGVYRHPDLFRWTMVAQEVAASIQSCPTRVSCLGRRENHHSPVAPDMPLDLPVSVGNLGPSRGSLEGNSIADSAVVRRIAGVPRTGGSAIPQQPSQPRLQRSSTRRE